MESPISYLVKARVLLLDSLGEDIILDELNETLSQLKIKLKLGIIVYLKYNEFGEYGYQIIFSSQKGDFSRFDNFDDRWEVSTKPHHFHIRGKNIVVASPMVGKPGNDIPILVRYIKKDKID